MRRPSSAHAIALLALIVSLGGTSYAAVRIGTDQLRDGAVTSRKLSGNAVTSTKVRNGSLLARDFRAGQLPRGPAGIAGPRGAVGPQGAAGTARAWALVAGGNPPGLNRASGVSAVTHGSGTGVYCLTAPGIDPARTVLIASVATLTPSAVEGIVQWRADAGAGAGCPAGSFVVRTLERAGNGFQNSDGVSFSVAIP